MSTFFGDFSRDFDDAFSKHFYGGYPVIFKFKTAPSDSLSLSQSYKFEREDNESGVTQGYTGTNTVGLNHSSNDKQVATKFKFNNSAAVYEVQYKPQDLNKDKVFSIKHNSKLCFATQNVSSTESLKFGGPFVSDIKAALNLDFKWTNAQGGDQVVKGAVNFTHGDFNFGVKTDYSVGRKQV